MKKWIGLPIICLLAISMFHQPALRPIHADPGGDEELLFSKARIYIEYNATDEDVGIQVLLDGEPWKLLKAYGPDNRLILDVIARRSLKQQGLTEFFFESSEPSLAEVSLEEFLERFPEGEYEFEGKTTDGADIEGEATLTHVIPAGVEVVAPVSLTDDPPVVDPDDFVIEWEPVTETIDGSDALEIAGYQVIVEQVEPLRAFSVHLPASATNVTIPPEFFELDNTVHKFEILAIEAGGNQTIVSGEFVTEP